MKSKILIPSLIATSLALAAVVSVPAGVNAANVGASTNASAQPTKGSAQNTKKGPAVNVGEKGRMIGASSTRPAMSGSSTRPVMSKPSIVGRVTAVSGSTLTVDSFRRFATSSATTTYMIDASKAVVKKANATTTLSTVVVGDLVLAQGTLNGTSMTANLIINGVRPIQNAPKGNGASMNGNVGAKVGFFGGIKHFFAKLFGF